MVIAIILRRGAHIFSESTKVLENSMTFFDCLAKILDKLTCLAKETKIPSTGQYVTIRSVKISADLYIGELSCDFRIIVVLGGRDIPQSSFCCSSVSSACGELELIILGNNREPQLVLTEIVFWGS